MCGHIVRKEGIVAVASFLNDDGPLFNFSFRSRRVGRNMKSRGRRVDRRNLSLSVSKVQNDGGYDILKWGRMA